METSDFYNALPKIILFYLLKKIIIRKVPVSSKLAVLRQNAERSFSKHPITWDVLVPTHFCPNQLLNKLHIPRKSLFLYLKKNLQNHTKD